MTWNDKRNDCFTLNEFKWIPSKWGGKRVQKFSFWGRIINFDATNITVLYPTVMSFMNAPDIKFETIDDMK